MLGKNIRMALTTMRANRSRTLFTMLGVILAVASVTTVVSVGDGIKATVTKQANQYSKDVVTIRPSNIGGSGLSGSLSSLATGNMAGVLTKKDATEIAKVPHVSNSLPLAIVGSGAKGDASFNGVVFGVSSDLPDVINQQLAYGIFFSSKDNNNNVAVLGSTAAQKLFDQDVPLGRSFTIHGQEFIVDGVLNSFASTPLSSGTNFNNAIFVPSSAASTLAPNGASIYEILAKVDGDSTLDQASRGIAKTLAKTHGGQNDYQVLQPNQLANGSTTALGLLTDLIVAAAAIALLVSGIGIMNVMLVSVTERVHEIGIRKAVGATNRQILSQFMTEAGVLSIFGSVVGVLVSLIACLVLNLLTSLTPRYDWKVAGLSCGAAIIIGSLFGSIPALRAARKDPIAALRNE